MTVTATPTITSSASMTVTATPAMTSTVNAVAAAGTVTSTAAAPVQTPASTAENARFYTVRSGDTLMIIGVATGIDWQQIAAANGITGDTSLQVGQQLRLPAAGSSQTATMTPASGKMTTYQVQSGDTLGSIGLHFGVTAQDIAEANGISVDSMLQLGQELQIPAPSGQP